MIDHKTIDTANRKYQRWAVDNILKAWETKQFVVIDSPTGTGKSIMAMVSQHMESIGGIPKEGDMHSSPHPAKIMTTTKALQRQYIDDFDVHHLFGAKNYTCPTGDAEYYKGKGCRKKRCGSRNICPYLVERDVAMETTSVINYAQAFSLTQLVDTAKVVVFDEAHDFDGAILDAMTIEMTESMCFKAGVIPPSWKNLDEIKIAAAKIGNYANTLPEDDDDREEMLSYLGACNSSDRIWIPEKKSAKFKNPLLKRDMIDPVVAGKKVLFLTATLGGFTQFCKNAGISKDEIAFIKVPEVFDPKLTPHIWDYSVGGLNASNLQESIPAMGKSIREILEIHEGERGIIHVPSYDLAKKLLEAVGSSRLVITNGNEYQQYDDIPDAVLVSPSLHTGVSFDNDKARFNIISKVSWAYLGDPYVSFRKGHDSSWYENEAKKKLHQQIGRTTRSMTDWSKIYFLDDNCKRLLAK